VQFTQSGDHVFRDLGFSAEEAESLRIRATLMDEIVDLLDRRNLTQTAAADLMGVSQPRLSDVVCGRIERFSIDALVEMLARAEVRIQLTFRRT
jgi:predicted XRE-type DNA-binding protein